MNTNDLKIAIVFFGAGYVAAYIGMLMTLLFSAAYGGCVYAGNNGINIISLVKDFFSGSSLNDILPIRKKEEQEEEVKVKKVIRNSNPRKTQ